MGERREGGDGINRRRERERKLGHAGEATKNNHCWETSSIQDDGSFFFSSASSSTRPQREREREREMLICNF